ncbi:DUF6223 family protein [Streptomyces sp. NPDC101115]|uniref:DUF6223 family protein n=1 Tax=Streptomyces sp. NPDC101115 TaxID=3366106 RepID=UPI0037F4B8E4
MATDQLLAASVYTFSLGRLGSSVGAIIALAGVIIAWRALARPSSRPGPVPAIVAGAVGLVLGGLVAATADGGLGTGNGLGGAYVSLILGLIATALGGRALSRARSHAWHTG